MLVFFLLLWITLFIFLLCTRKYHKDQFLTINQKEHPLKFIYPSAYFIYHRLKYHKIASKEEKSKAAWRLLATKGQEKQQFELYILKKLSLVLFFLFCSSLLAMVIEVKNYTDGRNRLLEQIMRPTSDEETSLIITTNEGGQIKNESITLDLHKTEEKRAQGGPGNESEELSVKQQQYEIACEYIDQVILMENPDWNMIGTNVFLPTSIPETNLSVKWDNNPDTYITREGLVQNESLEEPKNVVVKGEIYNESGVGVGVYQTFGTILPKAEYQYAIWKAALINFIKEIDENTTDSSTILLPTEFEGRQIKWQRPRDNRAAYLFVLGCIVAFMIYLCMDEELNSKMKLRRKQMLLDYPDIINKLALLIGAGMTVSGAWERVVLDYIKLGSSKEKRYAYEEMIATNQEMKLGVPETDAVEEFGHRAGSVEYLKFSSVLIQNMKKGTEGLTSVLDLMVSEAFESRKQLAKKLGEEAATKLLIPMMMMFILVLIVIMVPAFWSMRI